MPEEYLAFQAALAIQAARLEQTLREGQLTAGELIELLQLVPRDAPICIGGPDRERRAGGVTGPWSDGTMLIYPLPPASARLTAAGTGPAAPAREMP